MGWEYWYGEEFDGESGGSSPASHGDDCDCFKCQMITILLLPLIIIFYTILGKDGFPDGFPKLNWFAKIIAVIVWGGLLLGLAWRVLDWHIYGNSRGHLDWNDICRMIKRFLEKY